MPCHNFLQVLSALIWRSRTIALNMAPEQKTRVYFAVDGRNKFNPPLPKGYFGNGIALTFAMTTSADLCGKPLHHAVKLVQDAIALIDDRYSPSTFPCTPEIIITSSMVSSIVSALRVNYEAHCL
jgi:omega-hydroxypalmitate O-feruloyl transferase